MLHELNESQGCGYDLAQSKPSAQLLAWLPTNQTDSGVSSNRGYVRW